MSTEFLYLALSFLTLASFVMSLVFVLGIVWRVELELDRAFKCFAVGILFLLAIEVIDLLPLSRLDQGWRWLLPIAKFFAATSLLFGLYFMRDLIRRMDGEKPSSKGR